MDRYSEVLNHISNMTPIQIYNFCRHYSGDSHHPCNQYDFWHYALEREFGGHSFLIDPRGEYFKLKEKKKPIVPICTFRNRITGECCNRTSERDGMCRPHYEYEKRRTEARIVPAQSVMYWNRYKS